jgi:hypothetical protein
MPFIDITCPNCSFTATVQCEDEACCYNCQCCNKELPVEDQKEKVITEQPKKE